MKNSLFTRMLTTYLSLTLGLIILLGLTVAGVFVSKYISEKKAELNREAAEIKHVAINYVTLEKKNTAVEELSTIARKYDSIIQIEYYERKNGKVSIIGEGSEEKWGLILDYYVNSEVGDDSRIVNNMYDDIINTATMTYVLTLTNEQSEGIGTLYFTIDMSETNDAIRDVVVDVLLFSLIGITFAVIAVLYITRVITRPISQITDVVRMYTRGEYATRISYQNEDEIGALARSFNSMADELFELEDARRSFVANVSHELRSPLTSMRGFLIAMQDGTIRTEDYKKYLDIVISENNRMTMIVNDLLDIARIESGEYKLNLEVFDIAETIRTTIITFEARINELQLDVKLELGDEAIYVEADKSQIIQVLRNLIDNAVKYSRTGGILSISALMQKKVVWICVKDSGRGIPEEDIPYIFDRFYKVEKAHTPKTTSGTGLGLAIVKKIIDEHGETITVKNDNGACFMFSLKRAQARLPIVRTQKH